MPQIDPTSFPSQIFWLVVTFVSLYYVMARHIIPRIHTVIETRQQRIEYDLDRAASLKSEAEEAREEYEHALSEARSQAQNLLSDVSEAIGKASDEKHRELDDILHAKLAESEKAINDARKAADRELEPTAAEVACSITDKLIGGKTDKKAMLKMVKNHSKAVLEGKAA